MVSETQIVEDFDTFGVTLDDTKLIEKCLELCRSYGVDGEGIAACWISFASNNGYDSLTPEGLDHFEREELTKKKKNCIKKMENFQIYDASTIDEIPGEDENDLLLAYGGTPTPKQRSKRQLTPDNNIVKRHVGPSRSISAQFSPASISQIVSTPSQKYSSRNNAGNIVSSFGEMKKETWKADMKNNLVMRVIPMGGDEVLSQVYKYMFEKVRDAADVLDDVITSLADQMITDLNTEEYSQLRLPSNEAVCAAGRICCDSVGRLNFASVLLEGSREISSGSAVPLDLTHLSEFSLFPGQIVGVRGVNTTGNKLVVQELLPGKVLPPPDSPAIIKNATGAVQVVVASGPFTTTDNLLYEPLTDLLSVLKENPPHMLILLGPLLDAAHPLVVENQLAETHDAIVTRCLRIITSTLENSGTEVVLVPSSRDVCCPTVYPTPPYDAGNSITSVSDPVLLDINGTVVALTATDILFHLGKEEISYPPQGSDRLGRLARHILRQQCMYPLYPPPEGFCIDQEQADTNARLPCTPHLLILPSDLRYFIREMEGCVVINPERLAKGLVGGTYARLEIHSATEEKCKIVDRVGVHIIKV